MLIRNSSDRYGLLAIILHWAAALAILAMLATAISSVNAPSEASRLALLKLHGSLGVVFYLILVIRVVSGLVQRRPTPRETNPWLVSTARAVHLALLVLIAVQLLTGPLDIWSGGWPLVVFDLGALPSPFGPTPQPWHEAIGVVHSLSGLAILGLVLLHVGAALKHAIFDRDRLAPGMPGWRISSHGVGGVAPAKALPEVIRTDTPPPTIEPGTRGP